MLSLFLPSFCGFSVLVGLTFCLWKLFYYSYASNFFFVFLIFVTHSVYTIHPRCHTKSISFVEMFHSAHRFIVSNVWLKLLRHLIFAHHAYYFHQERSSWWREFHWISHPPLMYLITFLHDTITYNFSKNMMYLPVIFMHFRLSNLILRFVKP